ncbi:uncharacterized protein LOC124828746 isoform X1 [Vigna umbellata]|uniref:uncharacterized protein LOC124828746 isoform X1 n=1 Tax=Vigna umbellata TaxID=87088 RepID=UPI001F5E8F9D|nr:uncharacterized protein LOC124828746 isoform X1 [Vigna umbellata]
MSTPAKEAPKDQSDAEARDLPPDPAGSESPEAEEEEEEGECGFCLFMKGGGCRDAFTEWEKCVQEAETNNEDLLEKCASITAALKQCMDAHSSYYEPILRAEKLAEEQAIVELEKENLVSREDQKIDHVVEEVVTIELLKENQNLSPNESQAPPPSSQDPKTDHVVEEMATIELKKNQNLSQAPPPSSQDPK